MADLFKDIIPSIMKTGKSVVDNEKDYAPFVVNKAMSFHKDCILHANEMNMHPNLGGIMQYHYYLKSIRKYNRPFQKWQKLTKTDDMSLVKEYYGYSNEKAKDALLILSKEQIAEIKKSLYKGGTGR